MTLITTPHLDAPDDFYEALIDTHRDLSAEASHALNARLVLLLANHIGRLDVLLTSLDGPPAPQLFRFLSAGVIAVGVLAGGRQLLHKLSMKFYRIRDVQGLGAQTSAAATLMACLATGFPASPTHLISGSMVGAGVAKSVRSVRWSVVGEIVLSWVVTIPLTMALGAVIALIVRTR